MRVDKGVRRNPPRKKEALDKHDEEDNTLKRQTGNGLQVPEASSSQQT